MVTNVIDRLTEKKMTMMMMYGFHCTMILGSLAVVVVVDSHYHNLICSRTREKNEKGKLIKSKKNNFPFSLHLYQNNRKINGHQMVIVVMMKTMVHHSNVNRPYEPMEQILMHRLVWL